MSYNIEDENVPHEANVADAIDDQMERTSSHAAIADVASPGSSYVQAEHVAMRNAINDILEVLRDAGLIPST